jgi:putative hemolysin
MSLIEPITYSNQGSVTRRAFISLMEYMTGRIALEKAYRDVVESFNNQPAIPFFDHALEKLNVEISYPDQQPSNIPNNGPLLIVGNHPFGVLDGLLMNHVLHTQRKDFKILTNEVLTKAEPMLPWLIAVDDSHSAEGKRKNNRAIRESLEMLRDGQAIGIFPAGRLARPHAWGQPSEDWEWQPLVGHFALKAKTRGKPLMIQPVYFEGENSLLFRIAALSGFFTITRSLVIHELMNKRKAKVTVRIGKAFDANIYQDMTADAITKDLRQRTLALRGEGV